MVKVRNRTLFALLLVVACITPPAMARQDSWGWLAQVTPDAPDQASPDAPVDESVPETEDVAPEGTVEGTPETPAEPLPEAEVPGGETTPPEGGAATPTPPRAEEVPPATAPPGDVPSELPRNFQLPAEGLPEGTTLTIEGSSSMEVITRTLKQRFEEAFPAAAITVVEQSTDDALARLLAGEIEVAAIGRPLMDEEEAQGLEEVTVSREKIAVIVGSNNPFQGDVDSESFVRIFRGEITNWNQLGGPDLPIRFIDRPETSDTRRALGDYDLFGGNLTAGAGTVTVMNDSTAEVVSQLGNDGISYAIASQVLDQDNVRVLSMHSTFPDDPRYPYSQPRNYVYQGTATLSPAAEAFLAFATGNEGQAAVVQAKAAESADVAVADLPDRIIAMRPNGEGFVTGDRTGNLGFWDEDGNLDGSVAAHTGPVTALTFAEDGQRLISGGADGTIRFWDAIGTSVVTPINAGNGPVTSLVTQPDGGFISASSDGTLQRWDNMGNPIGEPITGHGDTVRAMALTSDSQTLITASEDGTIRRWNMSDGSPAGDPLVGHQGAVQALAVKSDGSFVSGGADATVRRWSATGVAVGTPIEMVGPVTALAASGSRIAVGDDTGSLKVLTSTPSAEADAAVAPAGDEGTTDVPTDEVPTDGETAPEVPPAEGAAESPDDPVASEAPAGDGVTPEAPAGDGVAPEAPAAGEAATGELFEDGTAQVEAPIDALAFTPDGERLIVSAGEMPLIRDKSGQSVATPSATGDGAQADGTTAPALPPQIQDLWERFRRLPLPMQLLLLPIAVLGIFLVSLLRSLQQDEEDGLEESDVVAELPEGDRDENFPPDFATDNDKVPGMSSEEASDSLDPNLSKARKALADGIALSRAGQHQEALQTFNRAIEAADLERLKAAATGASLIGAGTIIAQGLARRGVALANLDRSEEALKSFDRALEMEPNDLAAWVGKGNLMAASDRFDEALFCFDKAIELNPNIGAAWQGKANALQKMGRDAEARACFAKAQSLGGMDGEIPLDLEIPSEGAGVIDASTPDDFGDGDFGDADFGDADFGDADFADGDFVNNPVSYEPVTPSSLPVEASSSDLSEERPAPAPPPSGFEMDDAVPPELQEVITNLPSEPDEPSPDAETMPPIPVPPEVMAIDAAGEPGNTDIPREVLEEIEALPEEPDLPEPTAPVTVPMEVPPEVDDILAGQSTLPSAEDATEPETVVDTSADSDVTASSSETEAIPDQPEGSGYDPALEGLPPEVLEALKGIPQDSPDSFNLPSDSALKKPTPPPPPSNPRLKRSSS